MNINKSFKLGSCQQNQLEGWFETRLGQRLLVQEQAALQEKAAAIFGYHVVQIGSPSPHFDLLKVSPAHNRVVLDQGLGRSRIDLAAKPTRLPLATDSIDGVILPHTLDFSSNPHQLVREVERILIPEGKVLLSGFNPWSLWGGVRLLRMRSSTPPWCGHFFSSRRVMDWLALLGFDLLEIHFLNFRPPLQNQGLMLKLQFMERIGKKVYPNFGGVYIILAVKRVVTITPIRPKWSVKKQVIPTAAEPTIRNGT